MIVFCALKWFYWFIHSWALVRCVCIPSSKAILKSFILEMLTVQGETENVCSLVYVHMIEAVCKHCGCHSISLQHSVQSWFCATSSACACCEKSVLRPQSMLKFCRASWQPLCKAALIMLFRAGGKYPNFFPQRLVLHWFSEIPRSEFGIRNYKLLYISDG